MGELNIGRASLDLTNAQLVQVRRLFDVAVNKGFDHVWVVANNSDGQHLLLWTPGVPLSFHYAGDEPRDLSSEELNTFSKLTTALEKTRKLYVPK